MADLQRKAVSTVMEERSEPANVGEDLLVIVSGTGIDVRSLLLCEKWQHYYDMIERQDT
jgi:hypothetical protein